MKKVIKVLLIIIISILVLALVFFALDYSRVQDGKKPIFCIPLGYYLDGGTTEYFGLGYKVIDFSRLSGYDEIKIGTWAMQYRDFYKEIEDYENKIIIESAILRENEEKVHIEISGVEAEEIENMFNKLEFKSETCDGINDYIITIKDKMLSYGIEIYTSCHITQSGKEAILNAEDSYRLIEIINNHKDNTVSNEPVVQINEIEFVRTYNVKSDLKETDQTGNYNFYVVEQYQMNNPTIIKVDKKYKLEEKNNYEFTFKGVKKDEKDYSDQEIFTDFQIMNIEKTDKKGMEQRQDAIQDYTRIVKVDGKLYYDTGKESTVKGRCGVMDGKIETTVHEGQIPSDEGQSNFGVGFEYQRGADNTIEMLINQKWIVFEAKD